jgi:hypothetical protein
MNFFKQVSLAAIAVIALTLPARCASPEADVKKVVETFYRDYMRFISKPPKGDFDPQLIKWVNASPYTSPGFKKALAKAVLDARKKDPELGLDGDPILAGQDYPDKGYRAKTIQVVKDKATATMEGIGSESFHISVALIDSKGQWLIDGIEGIKASTK